MTARKKTLLVSICLLFLCTLGAYILFQISKSRTFQFFGGLTQRINTNNKIVALTFDDAPSPQTNSVLEILNKNNVQATFYMVGQNIEKYPAEAKAIADAGMELGNHSYSHKRMLFKTPSFINSEIQRTNNLIRGTGYEHEITFRPPNGKKLFGLPWYLHQHNIKTITWDVEPDTYALNLQEGNGKTNFLIEYTVENIKPGSIILMHPLCDSCVSDREALKVIIGKIQEKGYRFVTVSELLSSKPQL